MAPPRKPPVEAKAVQGLKYFRHLQPLLARLHEVGTKRDRAGNRQLFYDQYAALLLLFFFNPTLTSLRALQQATGLANVQKKLGCRRFSLGSLSAAARDFDAEPLQAIFAELVSHAEPLKAGKEAEFLKGLTAVDGTLLPALPKMAWALWRDDTHRAAKLHLHFDVVKGVPCSATLTAGNGNEKAQLRVVLEPGHLYVYDRGYVDYQLFQDVIDAGSSFIGRLCHNAVYHLLTECQLSAEAVKAGVLRDCVVHLGGDAAGPVLQQPLRIVVVASGKFTPQGQPEPPLILVTNCLDLDAAWIALGYKYRWTVELFFRWFKCILGCQHLLSTCQNGVAIQVYLALIVSVLIVLGTGQKPNRRTFEMLCLYFQGWASEEELIEHLKREHAKKAKS
jgi:hypothetical protein